MFVRALERVYVFVYAYVHASAHVLPQARACACISTKDRAFLALYIHALTDITLKLTTKIGLTLLRDSGTIKETHDSGLPVISLATSFVSQSSAYLLSAISLSLVFCTR